LVHSTRRVALAVAVLVVLAMVALVLFYGVGGPFGTINDGLNLAVGLGSSVLAAASIPRARAGALDLAAGALGILGGAVFALGAYLVLTDRTGWFLAGLASGVGAGFMGTWLLVLNRPLQAGSRTRVGSPRLGRLAGAVMVLGLLGVPGWMSGVDDWVAAPWYVSIGMLCWLGTYVLYPAWCLRVSRAG
jgi:hypothetical protein